MEEPKTDRRVRKTKQLLRTTLIHLLMEKKLNTITVKEVCELADINRGTFYLHYRDVFDLFEKIEDEIFQEIVESIQKHAPPEVIGAPDHMLPTFLDVFQYLSENYDACIVLLENNRNQELFERLAQIGCDNCVTNWMKMFHVEDRNVVEFFYFFTVSGCIGIMKYWLDNGRKETAQELAYRAEQYITRGIGMLEIYSKK